MSKALLLSSAAVTFVLGIALGFALSPSYASQVAQESSMSMDLGPADRRVDLRYIDGMIAHHQAAIYLANQGLASHRQEIRDLSKAIIEIDTKGIVDLYGRKKEWYADTRTISAFERVELGEVDETFDLRFLNAMIAHHEEAIAAGREIQTKSTRTEVITIADEVRTVLGNGRDQLKSWRADWYQL